MYSGLDDDFEGKLHHHGADRSAEHDKSSRRLDHLGDPASFKNQTASDSDERNQYAAKGTLVHSSPHPLCRPMKIPRSAQCPGIDEPRLLFFIATGGPWPETWLVSADHPLDIVSFYRHMA
jgi:hypothetical protein